MPNSSLINIHLFFIEEVLPVGMAIVERVKKGGLEEVTEIFNTSDDPVNQLRAEGDLAASNLRERLDEISPGLGNPVINVKVSIENPEKPEGSNFNESKLFSDFKILLGRNFLRCFLQSFL